MRGLKENCRRICILVPNLALVNFANLSGNLKILTKRKTKRNRDSETPSRMAKRMGFTQLSSDLGPVMQASQENPNNTCK